MTRWVGLSCLLAVLLLVGILPLASSHDPMRTDLARSLAPPDHDHLLGTDGIGRDILARLAAGALNSLGVALVALVVSSLLGAALGGSAGLLGGPADGAISAAADLLLAFPRFVILLNLTAVLALSSSWALGLLVGTTSWMHTARLVRTEALSLRRRPFVEAARVAGSTRARILVRHIGPQLFRLVAESAGLRLASVILLAASLDYLGVGLPADRPTWGRMVRDGQAHLQEAPWVALAPIATLCLSVVGLVMAGEGRREAPRT